jgi:hypothetical protein
MASPLEGSGIDPMAEQDTRWVARLTPTEDCSLDALLEAPLGLDVWERHPDALVVVGTEAQLAELERRRLARVEWLSSVAQYLEDAQRQADC